MAKLTLIITGAVTAGIGSYIWFGTAHWYDTIPGVAQTGPLNLHFARDVALAYAVSGVAMVAAARSGNRALACFGASWPLLHAVFHLWIWAGRGAPLDLIVVTNLGGIQIPAWVGALAAWRMPRGEAAQ